MKASLVGLVNQQCLLDVPTMFLCHFWIFPAVSAVQRIIEKVVSDYLSGEFYLMTVTCPSL